MNQHPGVLGRKLGSTQIFNAEGNVENCAVIEASPCVVVGPDIYDEITWKNH